MSVPEATNSIPEATGSKRSPILGYDWKDNDPGYVSFRNEGEKLWTDLLKHMVGIDKDEYIHCLVFNDLRHAMENQFGSYVVKNSADWDFFR